MGAEFFLQLLRWQIRGMVFQQNLPHRTIDHPEILRERAANRGKSIDINLVTLSPPILSSYATILASLQISSNAFEIRHPDFEIDSDPLISMH